MNTVVIKNGVASYTNSTIIPIEHIAYQEMPRDGIYTTSEGTCGGKCSVGIPKPKCVSNKIYSKKKCAVVFLRPLKLDGVEIEDVEVGFVMTSHNNSLFISNELLQALVTQRNMK